MALSRSHATRFVVLIGIVSLFADMTYEGGRSVTGPYLAVLGASGAAVGIVAGLGELLGYGLRLVSGYFADQTRKYWTIAIVGYTINLLAVPALALAGNWPMAAALIILERAGKAVRSPAKDVMLSNAAHEMGRGWGFGLAEALDKTGAMMGPLIVALILWSRGGDYALAFAVLIVPAMLAIAVLFFARSQYPRPEDLEVKGATLRDLENRRGFPRVFWLYLAASAFVAAGFADFPLMAFHFQRTGVVSEAWIPIFYAVGMGVGALGALVLGRTYDKRGIGVLAGITLVAAFFAPLAFFGSFSIAALGILLWGLGLGAHESLMKAAVADMVPTARRASAYGMFNLFFGVAWFAGSAVLGFLYDVSILWLVIVSVALQLVAVPMLWMLPRTGEAPGA